MVALSAAACGASSAKTVTVSRPGTVTHTVTDTVTKTAPATTGAAAVTSGGASAASATPRCRTGQLAFTYSTNGATGSYLIGGTLTNHSSSTCSLYGYPGLAMVGKQGQALPTNVVRNPGPVMPHVAEQLVVLGPGGRAGFFANFRDAEAQMCPRVWGIEITPPNAYTHLNAPLRVNACRNQVHVSPVFTPGSTNSY